MYAFAGIDHDRNTIKSSVGIRTFAREIGSAIGHEAVSRLFSYAHLDADSDPRLIDALSKDLELRVTTKLTNAEFSIWRDAENIRTGDIWQPKIEEAVNTSDIFILLLSPKWVESDFCLKEYEIFAKTEIKRPIGEYVVPILIKDISAQKKHFNLKQNKLVNEIELRQYTRIMPASNKPMLEAERASIIERIADDISGMIDRLRCLTSIPPQAPVQPARRVSQPRELSQKAYNFAEVDFIDDPEIHLEMDDQNRGTVLAQFDFLERMYVQGAKARVEFGIRRAVLSISGGANVNLQRSGHIQSSRPQVRYLTLHDRPPALVLAIDPPPGKQALGELPLPPGPKAGENRFAEIGHVVGPAAEISAEISVSLSVEGLMLVDGRPFPGDNSTKKAIEAIAVVAAMKHKGAEEGRMTRSVRIREKGVH